VSENQREEGRGPSIRGFFSECKPFVVYI
jgi:hypothetical protein